MVWRERLGLVHDVCMALRRVLFAGWALVYDYVAARVIQKNLRLDLEFMRDQKAIALLRSFQVRVVILCQHKRHRGYRARQKPPRSSNNSAGARVLFRSALVYLT